MAVMLVIILLASELFTNALEHLGAKLKISEGVTGSLFAAVGTALPETMVPLLAIFAGTTNAQLNEEVGVGAILGAPLMLSTLSTCLMALAVVPTRGAAGFVDPERSGFVRDLDFFLLAFVVAAAAMFVPEEARYVRGGMSAILVTTYFVYILLTVRVSNRLVDEGHGTRAHHKLCTPKGCNCGCFLSMDYSTPPTSAGPLQGVNAGVIADAHDHKHQISIFVPSSMTCAAGMLK
jgi:cation:H+ antiporter